MKFKRQREGEVAVNLTPLIDVVFLLLIFFMVSTTFTKETRLKISLPEATGAQVEDQPDVIEVVVDKHNRYAINGQSLANQDLKTLMQALRLSVENIEEPQLLISADGGASHQAVIRVMDAAGQLGLARLSMSTVNPTNNEQNAAALFDGAQGMEPSTSPSADTQNNTVDQTSTNANSDVKVDANSEVPSDGT